MSALAKRLGATEGQVWSLAIGLAIAIVLAVAGIPPVVHHARESLATAPAATARAPGHAEAALTPVTEPAVTAFEPDVLPARPSATPAPRHAVEVTAPPAATPAPPFGTIRPFASVTSPLGGVAVAGKHIYVATNDDKPTHIYGFDADGKRTADITITGQPQHVDGISALAAEARGALVGTDVDTNRVLRIDPRSGRVTTLATIVDLPACALAPGAPACEPGLEDHKPLLTGVAAAANGTILVADSAQGTIWRLRDGAQPEAWSQPMQQASGDGPRAIAIASDGSVLEAVGTDLNPSNPTAAAVYRIPVTREGAAGDPVLVAKLARADQPIGIVASPDGRIFVALRATSTIVVLAAGGQEQARLDGNDLDSPAGLGLDGAGDLFATTGRYGAPGRVLRITI